MRRLEGAARGRAVALGLAISALFAWLTFRDVDLSVTWEAITRMSLPLLLLAVAVKGAAFLALALRSRITTAAAGPLSLRVLAAAHFVGYTGNNLLPFRLGELLRIEYMAQKAAAPRSLLLTTVVVERVLDSIFLIALFAATAPWVLGARGSWGTGVALMAAGTLGALALAVTLARTGLLPAVVRRVGRFWPMVGRVLERRADQMVDGLSSLADGSRLGRAAGATLLYWSVGFCTLTILIRAFGFDLPWWAPAFIIALVAVGTALPSSPAYVGTYHYFSAWALGLLGVPAEQAASFALVSHGVAVGPYSLVGLTLFAPWIASWSSLIREREAEAEAEGSPG